MSPTPAAATPSSPLANDSAVEGIVLGGGGVIDSLPAGALHVSLSTISVALSETMTTAHAKAGQRFVAAPVFGRPDVAAAGQLFIVAAGEPSAVAAASPLFEAMGQRNDEPLPLPQWIARPDGRKVLYLWPEAGANSYANDDILTVSHNQSPDPALAEIVRFLARRAARDWFAQAGGQ